ncbi:DNA methyltransferase [Acinetobacter sp. ANC 7454]|uniref:DNA methyltransferase n=1 Tax=Acinetobacter thermotolerans TaxID=3151487 RepID=UPI00325B8D31
MNDKVLSLDLDDPNQLSEKESGPVECLGKTFENDQARRDYYLAILAEKLKDPEFRKIEGFPIGEDEDILNLSDPPYYTACPNPFLEDFIHFYGHPYDSNEEYKREPYAADVSEGKNAPIYNAHSYHTKVPHKAIMRYILHYTNPGDIIYDGFSGSGMAGVAAQMCGNEREIQELGYTIDEEKKYIFDGKNKISKLGSRYAILSDLSPAANNIAYGNNFDVDVNELISVSENILNSIEQEYSWMFKTKEPENGEILDVKYYVWSEILYCSNCNEEIVFSENALSDDYKNVTDEFECEYCHTILNKKNLEVVYENFVDPFLNKIIQRPKRVVTHICYSKNRRNLFKKPDEYDYEILEKVNSLPLPLTFPHNVIPDMQMMRVGRMKPTKITHIHHFFFVKHLHILNTIWNKCNSIQDFKVKEILCYWIDSNFVNLSLRNRFRPGVSFPYNPMAGVFYIPMMSSEANPFIAYRNKIKAIINAFRSVNRINGNVLIGCGSATDAQIPNGSIDYIFTDPPFGENIYYSDLNFFIESWRKVFTNTNPEAIIDRVKNKDLIEYMGLMQLSFKEYYRVLKPGRWITVEFSNTKSSVWNGIQTALSNAGFVVADVSILDKKQGSFQSVNSSTAVKQDLVISAYKPKSNLDKSSFGESSEDGVWDFIRSHLGYLPIIKRDGNELVKVPERDPRILFDQVVAYFVRHMRDVPLSSKEFQNGLIERFSERDGMIFLPEQVAQYDKARMSSTKLRQLSIFVHDEASAIDWLRQLLMDKPQTYQDIQPKFMSELAGWKKAEIQLELIKLLEQNFLKFNGQGLVPAQIHSYLSTNFKELRSLDKDDPELLAKAKDRWFVPDPNNEEQLQALRERDLLKQFEEYKTFSGKKIKQVRMEAVRAGFKKAWKDRDYETIIHIAEKIPESLLQEDEKLLMWYDQAQTRHGNTGFF